MKLYFNTKIVKIFSKIKNLGPVNLEAKVYRTNRMLLEYNNVYFRINIIPEKSRTKQLKMIFDIDDITSFFDPNFNI